MNNKLLDLSDKLKRLENRHLQAKKELVSLNNEIVSKEELYKGQKVYIKSSFYNFMTFRKNMKE